MLAPEEVFAGKGDIKEETELTKTERKRRRAKKKRQFKGGILTQLPYILNLKKKKHEELGDFSICFQE